MKRIEGELYAHYHARRMKENVDVENYLRGKVIWDSKTLGTYIKSTYGSIGTVNKNKVRK